MEVVGPELASLPKRCEQVAEAGLKLLAARQKSRQPSRSTYESCRRSVLFKAERAWVTGR